MASREKPSGRSVLKHQERVILFPQCKKSVPQARLIETQDSSSLYPASLYVLKSQESAVSVAQKKNSMEIATFRKQRGSSRV